MKAAKDAGEEYRKGNIQGRNETILALWEEHLKDPIVALDKALKCVENSYWRSWPECFEEGVSCNGWRWLPPKFVGKTGIWPHVDLMDSLCLRTASIKWNVLRMYGAAWRALLLPDTEGTSDTTGR